MTTTEADAFDCVVCGKALHSVGGQVAHGRAHVRQSEAVELVRLRHARRPERMFVRPLSSRVRELLDDGFRVVPRG